jgi:hypothetical protein
MVTDVAPIASKSRPIYVTFRGRAFDKKVDNSITCTEAAASGMGLALFNSPAPAVVQLSGFSNFIEEFLHA